MLLDISYKVKFKNKNSKKIKVEYNGSGETVTYQSPSANEKVYEGETIRLLLTE